MVPLRHLVWENKGDQAVNVRQGHTSRDLGYQASELEVYWEALLTH